MKHVVYELLNTVLMQREIECKPQRATNNYYMESKLDQESQTRGPPVHFMRPSH
jgi:hypothetical protein